MVTVTILVTTSEPVTNIDRAVASLSSLLVYVPLAAWGITQGGRRRVCIRHRRGGAGRLRCSGDHGVERRRLLYGAIISWVVVMTFALLGAWEEAAVLAMFPLGLLVVASGYRSRSVWHRAAGTQSRAGCGHSHP